MTITATRADRRRDLADGRRADRYSKSKFIDRAVHLPFTAAEQHKPFTIAEIMERAVERRDYKRAMQKVVMLSGDPDFVFDNRAPHANRGTQPRKDADRRPANLRRWVAYLRGLINNAKGLHANGMKMPAHYLNGPQRYEQAPMAMAA